jgi:diguanylate cyclase (GGDEF)-like protein
MPGDERDRIEQLERENVELRRAVGLLHRVATLVRRSLELEPTCYAILTGVTAGVGLGLNRAMLFLVGDGERRLRGTAAVGPADAEEADRVWRQIEADAPDLDTLYQSGLARRDEPGPLDRRVRSMSVAVDDDNPVALCLRRSAIVRAEGSEDLDGLLDLETCVAVPLHGEHGLVGVLYGDNRFSGRQIDDDTEQVLQLVADHAGRAIESAHAFERVARQARTDALTGLGHHGAMMGAIASAIDEAQASGRSLGLAMIDLDDFKRINDTHGHLVGDALLAGVAARLRDVVRADAGVYRYGGEEFAVLLPGVAVDELTAVGERLRLAMAERPFPVGSGGSLAITCSVGLASLELTEGEADALIGVADAALLEAKRTGKNRVVFHRRAG